MTRKSVWSTAAFWFTIALALSPIMPARSLEPDGRSFERAILIEASNTREGIAAEYDHLRRFYPGWRRTRQALLRQNGRVYDELTIVSPENETRLIYFDITNFFGRM